MTYLRLTAVPLGFDADRVLSFNLSLPAPTYPDDASIRRVTESLLAALRSVPGVTSAAVTSIPPLSVEDNVSAFKIKDRPDDAADPPVAAQRIDLPRILRRDAHPAHGGSGVF